MEYPKQVIVMRKDLKMPRGKIAAQAAHASNAVLLNMMDKQFDTNNTEGWMLRFKKDSPLGQWLNGSFTKVCVAVTSEQELSDIYDQLVAAGISVSKIVDNGLTVFNGVPTWTCIAVEPVLPSKIDPITGHLPLYN